MCEEGQVFEVIRPDAWLVLLGTAAESRGLALAEELRNQGLRVVCNCGGGGVSQQFRRADQSGARFAVVIGEDEIRQAQVTVKLLRGDGSQVAMRDDVLADYLREGRPGPVNC
jgi:histidyl-tRNA synthetase